MGAPPQIMLGNLGMADSLILMVLALVVFGPRRLPQIGRQIGKLMYEFRKASNDFKFQMEEELRLSEDADRRKKEEAERARNLALSPLPTNTVEAQADVGAVEQVSVSAQPASSYPGTHLSDTANPETTAFSSEEQQIRYPRLNPPSTGAPIAAARPGMRPDTDFVETGSAAPSEIPQDVQAKTGVPVGTSVPAETSVVAEANIGAEPAPTAPQPPAASSDAPAGHTGESTPSETVSQHG